MDRVKFSRKAARIVRTIKSFEEKTAFRKACREAVTSNPDNPLSVMSEEFQKYFVEAPTSAKALLASLNKYNPDQERDAGGRFGSGSGGGSGWHESESTNREGTPIIKFESNRFSIAVPKSNEAIVKLMRGAQNSLDNLPKMENSQQEYKASQKVNITVAKEGWFASQDAENVPAMSDRNGSRIIINPDVPMFQEQNESEFVSYPKGSVIASGVGLDQQGTVDYMLAHEYGHTLDNRSVEQTEQDRTNKSLSMAGMSRYGKSDPSTYEAFAEAFAHYALRGGQVSGSKAVAYYAGKYGWGATAGKFLVIKSDSPQIEIWDTFDPDNPPVYKEVSMKELNSVKSFKSAKDLLDFVGKYSADQERDERGRFGSGGGGGSTPKPSSNGGKKYSAEAKAAAKSKYAQAVAAEPAITATMEKVSEKFGGKMAGLEFKLKTEESLTRKIDDNAVKYNGDRAEAAANISDANRYTMTFEPQQYSNGVQEAVKDLEKEGYTLNVKNYWNDDNPYKGINVAATAPDGTKFELQFHTPESHDVKENALHGLYETFRTATDEATRLDLHNQMVAVSAQTTVPSGIEQLSASWAPIAEPYVPAIKSDRISTEGR